MWDILVVGLGGAVGANCRYALSEWSSRRWGLAFPYGTVLINVSGSFVLSLFVTLVSRQVLADPFYRWLIAVGFCGGYTTFSTYTYETLALLRQRKISRAMLYNQQGSHLAGLLAALLGVWLGNLQF